jgi:hypothetical protein
MELVGQSRVLHVRWGKENFSIELSGW